VDEKLRRGKGKGTISTCGPFSILGCGKLYSVEKAMRRKNGKELPGEFRREN